jgi:hypothetical protein
MGQLDNFWKDFWVLEIWGKIQRRGGRVNIPEIGSRVGVFVFGGIFGIYAVLRREFNWRNLKLVNLGFLSGRLTWGCEEGGPLVCQLGFGGTVLG